MPTRREAARIAATAAGHGSAVGSMVAARRPPGQRAAEHAAAPTAPDDRCESRRVVAARNVSRPDDQPVTLGGEPPRVDSGPWRRRPRQDRDSPVGGRRPGPTGMIACSLAARGAGPTSVTGSSQSGKQRGGGHAHRRRGSDRSATLELDGSAALSRSVVGVQRRRAGTTRGGVRLEDQRRTARRARWSRWSAQVVHQPPDVIARARCAALTGRRRRRGEDDGRERTRSGRSAE